MIIFEYGKSTTDAMTIKMLSDGEDSNINGNEYVSKHVNTGKAQSTLYACIKPKTQVHWRAPSSNVNTKTYGLNAK